MSWYEAAAYAEFKGKSLPTLFHWNRAADTSASSFVIPLSNFGRGPAPVGSHRGLSSYGVYDMAGNVKEWCWNEAAGGRRYILGGGWGEPYYMFNDVDAQPPMARAPAFGFRTVKYLAPLPDSSPLKAAIAPSHREYERERPISDATFRVYKSLFSYDSTDLGAVVEEVDSNEEHWRRERVTYQLPHEMDRMTAFLYLPRDFSPPYQAVIYFPGSDAIYQKSSKALQEDMFDFIVRSGRAVICPLYQGTYERGGSLRSDYPNTTNVYRDHVIQWSRELGVTIDYLETRSDIRPGRIGYYGLSWGAALGAIFPAVEKRFKVSVLHGGGFYLQKALSEVDQINFAPRVTLPTLMLNGRYDFFYPVEGSQKPMFKLLGTPAKDKEYVLFDSGHIVPRNEMVRRTLEWLDRYLGSVK